MVLRRSERSRAAVTMKFEGANPNPAVAPVDRQVTRANYLIGNDPSKWITGLPTYSRVSYEGLYPGIDLLFYGEQGKLEYDFTLAVGADPRDITLKFDGASGVLVNSTGDLIVQTPAGNVTHHKPLVYQEETGGRVEIAAEYAMKGANQVGFRVGFYDRSKPLVIDPVLIYSTYLGGSLDDFGRHILVDNVGNAYVAGNSFSSDFLSTASAENSDVFVGKMRQDGLFLSYSFFGGNQNDAAEGLAIDADGNIYVAGTTSSPNFPRVDVPSQGTAGGTDAFVTKLNAAGNAFIYSLVIGGSGDESGVDMAIDGLGGVYVTGRTTSANFPTANALQGTFGGGSSDAFVARLVPDGSGFVYSTYLGGADEELLNGLKSSIAIDTAGDAFVVGDTLSTDFPVKNPLQGTKGAGAASPDGYVTKIAADGSDLIYSTYLGGDSDDSAAAIAVDVTGNAYVTGSTRSLGFPGSPSARPDDGTTDAFAAKLNAAGSALSYLTFIGGSSGNETGASIAVDIDELAVIAGSAGEGLPVVDQVQPLFGGGLTDAFVARLSQTGSVNFATYLGGGGNDAASGVSLDPTGSVYVTGFTDSTDFLTFIPLRKQNSGGVDMFIAKIDPDIDPKGPLVLKLEISGKKLIVFGQNFRDGAKILVNDVAKKTKVGEAPGSIVFSPKAAKKVKPGDTIVVQVRNPNGRLSNPLFFTRPS
jgi:Beta-propeller repeat